VDAKWHHYRNSADIDKSIGSGCLNIETRKVGRTERNTDEIETLYRQHGAALLLFASAISGDRGRAQDAVHQVFLKAIENGSVSQAINKKAYLFACVRNAVLNDAKVQDRTMRLDVNSAWFSPPGRDYAGEQNLRRALGKLPDGQREVIVLHVWGELTFSEIADLLGVSSNTVASRYRYALAKLRGSMLAKENSCADSR
jgi:RNA polymerase sigma-70 factor (ECF subfamily)